MGKKKRKQRIGSGRKDTFYSQDHYKADYAVIENADGTVTIPYIKGGLNYYKHYSKTSQTTYTEKEKRIYKYNSIEAIDDLIEEWIEIDKCPSESDILETLIDIKDREVVVYFNKKVQQIKDEHRDVYEARKEERKKNTILSSAPIAGLFAEKESIAKKQSPKQELTPKTFCLDKNVEGNEKYDGIIMYKRNKNTPQYGYARDRYGRIQERDHYIEERHSNPYHTNSDYDVEDDNDSMYDNFD